MRGKVLLSVRLAVLERPFEFRVPLDMTVEQAARLMSQTVAQMEPARYEASDEVDLMLCDEPGAGGQLNPNESVRALVEQGTLVEGAHLALV